MNSNNNLTNKGAEVRYLTRNAILKTVWKRNVLMQVLLLKATRKKQIDLTMD